MEPYPAEVTIAKGKGTVDVDEKTLATLEMLEGDLPAKALMLTKEWARLHQKELFTIWETQEFIALPPLE